MTDVIEQSTSATKRVYYGWTVVGTVFVILMVTSGLGFYNASVILSAAEDELNVSTGAVSGATAMFFGISGITGFVLARQMESRDLRLFYLAGGVLGAVSLFGLRWVDSVARLYVFFALFGTGFAMAGLVPGTTLVTRWFDARRSIALSIASTGLSLGGIVLTPVAAWLIDQRQLAGAGPILALIWVIGVIPIGLLLIRSRPADMGLLPDGASPDESGDSVQQQTDNAVAGASFLVARRTRFFLMMCVSYALIFFAQVGALAHLFNLASERADKATAGTALSLLAFTSVLGRLAGGVVVLKVPTKVLTAALMVLQGISLAILANSFSSIGLIVAAIIVGISVGNLLMLQPLLIAEAFGVAEYGRIYALNQLCSTLGVAGGPFALGLLRDAFDYQVAFIVGGIASVLGAVVFVMAGPVTSAHEYWDVGRKPTAPSPSPA